MVSLPTDILLGIYLGALVGIIPALCVWAASFGFRYSQELSLPRTSAVGLGVVLAAVTGGGLSVVGESTVGSAGPIRFALATVLVVGLSMYAHTRGDEMAAEFPRNLSISDLGTSTVNKERAELTSDGNEVRIRFVGEIGDVEGYPSMPATLREEIRDAEIELPVDLRLDELERRVEDRLELTYDLASVSVDIDDRGRARVDAAPPFSGLSKRVGSGRHAVTVSGLVPTGVARGDEVTVITPSAQVRGTVVSAQTETESARGTEPTIEPRSDAEPADGDDPGQIRAPTTTGGRGEVTVAVTRTDVQPLLEASGAKIVVESRDLDREYEVVSMLRRVGHQIQRVGVSADGELDGATLGTAGLQEDHDVAVLAVRKPGGWLIAPRGETRLDAGDELFAAGTRSNLEGFATTVA
jgi:hypothetical protein